MSDNPARSDTNWVGPAAACKRIMAATTTEHVHVADSRESWRAHSTIGLRAISKSLSRRRGRNFPDSARVCSCRLAEAVGMKDFVVLFRMS